MLYFHVDKKSVRERWTRLREHFKNLQREQNKTGMGTVNVPKSIHGVDELVDNFEESERVCVCVCVCGLTDL